MIDDITDSEQRLNALFPVYTDYCITLVLELILSSAVDIVLLILSGFQIEFIQIIHRHPPFLHFLPTYNFKVN